VSDGCAFRLSCCQVLEDSFVIIDSLVAGLRLCYAYSIGLVCMLQSVRIGGKETDFYDIIFR
jgi:hypothetical protein